MINKKGFTLVELLIYLGILILLIGVIAAFLPNLLKTNSYAQKKEEAVSATQRTLEAISQEIRHASDIYYPTSVFNTTTGQLSLETTRYLMPDETISFVDFYLDNEHIYIKKEGMSPELIVPEKLRVTGLTFDQLTSTSSLPAVRVTIEASYFSSSEEVQNNTAVSLSTTASLRSY